MRTRLWLTVILGAAVGIVVASCASSDSSEFTLVASGAIEDPYGMVGFALDGDDVTAMAPTLTVKAGEPLTVTLENAHGQYAPTGDSHDFAVIPILDDIPTLAATGALADEVLWDSAIPKLFTGESGEVTFTPDEPGRYVYVCTLPSHAARGMIGDFIVES
jgi:FtsP/CotA-like multicopper oxidase with cupredoxin domain